MGSQVPRYNIAPAPKGFNTDHGEDATFYAAQYGLKADEWQETVCKSWMRQDKTGRWCAKTWGVTVPRQNGKNGALEVVELYGMVQLGLKFLHTAHEVKTARKAFLRIKSFFGEKRDDPHAKFPALNALVKEIRSVNGQEAIILKNGGSVEFIARSKGSGRGFTVDVLVLDEAQDLQDGQLEALLPTISAAPCGDPVTIYMGTPPKPDELEAAGKGEPFVRVRQGAIDKTDKRVSWVDFSADGFIEDMTPVELTAFLNDKRNWAAANPALGARINLETIETERSKFNDGSFARERLNMWPKGGGLSSPIPGERWNPLKLAPEDIDPSWKIAAIGLDMNPERTKVTIGIAAFTPAGVHLDIAVDAPFSEEGTSALVAWLWERTRRLVPVVIDGFSPAKSLEPILVKRGIKTYLLQTREMIQACGNFYDDVMTNRTISHAGNDRLDKSLAGSIKDVLNKAGEWKFNRADYSIDLGPLIAVVNAHFGALKFARRRSEKSSTSSESGHGFQV